MSYDYWSKFWLEYTKSLDGKGAQEQVLRTRNKASISEEQWQITVETIKRDLPAMPSDSLLDLCCGNGLLTEVYSPLVKEIISVDLSPQLVENLKNKNLKNVTGIASDIRKVNFSEGQFTKVLWYAGIQYLSEPDIVTQIKKIRTWLKPGGQLFIGDIPERTKMWDYFNSLERQELYFNSLEKNSPIIGTWVDRKWIENLILASGFSSVEARSQDPELIYSDFRFDIKAFK